MEDEVRHDDPEGVLLIIIRPNLKLHESLEKVFLEGLKFCQTEVFAHLSESKWRTKCGMMTPKV